MTTQHRNGIDKPESHRRWNIVQGSLYRYQEKKKHEHKAHVIIIETSYTYMILKIYTLWPNDLVILLTVNWYGSAENKWYEYEANAWIIYSFPVSIFQSQIPYADIASDRCRWHYVGAADAINTLILLTKTRWNCVHRIGHRLYFHTDLHYWYSNNHDSWKQFHMLQDRKTQYIIWWNDMDFGTTYSVSIEVEWGIHASVNYIIIG